MKNLWIMALAALALASCQDAPVTPAPAPISFAGRAPIRVTVAQVNVLDNYNAPMQAPNVDHQFPTPPDTALKQWAGQRLVAIGTQGSLEMSIDDASVRETMLPKTKGIKGFFTDDQDARYDAHLHASFRLYDGVNTMAVAQGDVDVTGMRTINEKATLAQREVMFNQLTQDMMSKFDAEAELQLRQHFANYLQ